MIPCSDYYALLLCKHYGHFEGLIANRFNDPVLLDTFDTKDRFYALCDAHGMDYPKTAVCTAADSGSLLCTSVDAVPMHPDAIASSTRADRVVINAFFIAIC